MAFSYLRSTREPVRASNADFQVENGLSTFIGRLIGLGFQEQAWKELRILKRRLDAALSLEKSKSFATKPMEATTAIQLVVELLTFEESILDPALSIITTYQILVLRLLALSKKPAQIEAALPFLLESNHTSPSELLRRLAKGNGKEAQRAIRQLASLAQLILSLAPSISSKEDHEATEPRLCPSPRTAFDLQVVCFKMQLTWWKLAGHRGAVEDEVLAPFTRCIRALVRRQKSEDGPIYGLISTAFDNIMDLVQVQVSQPAKSADSALASIYQLLGTSAQNERHYGQAQRWFQDLKAMMQPEKDGFARVFSISARLLAAMLKRSPLDPKAQELLDEVREGLDGCMSGSVLELNELFESLSLARRSTVGLLVSMLKAAKSSNSSDGLLESLKKFVLHYPQFARRWLGSLPSKDSSAKSILQFDQRRQIVMQSIDQTLDSTLMVVNSELQNNKMTFQAMDEVLHGCLRLLSLVEDPTLSVARSEQLGVYYVKMSSLYYAKFQQLKKDLGKSTEINKQILQALSRSIDTVKDRSLAQQEKSQIATKLEVFAELCKGSGRSNDAVRTLRSVCTNMIEEGALSKVTTALSSQSPSLAWSVDEKAETLSRTLRSIAKLDQSWNDWAFFLPEGERAAVLEHLMQISAANSSKGQPLKLHDASMEALLRLYTLDRFPIRRLRVLLHLLFQNLSDANEMEEIRDQTEEALKQVQQGSLSEDSDLCHYAPHWETYYNSIMTLVACGPFPTSDMEGAISAWKSMIKDCKARSDLDQVIDNPESLSSYLQSAGQFASLRGESSLHLSMLELSASLSKTLAEDTHNKMILNHTLLASQYLVIGHFSEAKKTHDRIQELLKQAEGVSRGLMAGFHLSQAEYFDGVGNIEEARNSLAMAKEICNEPTSSWAQSKSEKTLALASASFLDSTIALKQGRVQEALNCVKATVRLLSHDWSKIEASSRAGSSADMDNSTNSIADMNDKTSSNLAIGPRFWGLAFPLIRGLLHLSSVYAHLGMFQETIHYAQSAQKIAESTSSPLYKAQVSAWIGLVYHRAGQLEKALTYGNAARDEMPTDVCATKVQVACQLADLYRDIGEEEKATELLKLAEDTAKLLGDFGKPPPAPVSTQKPVTTSKARGAVATKVTRTTRATRTRAATIPATTSKSSKRVAVPKPQAAPAKEVSLPKDVFQASLMVPIILSRTLGLINKRDWTSALSTLELAKDLPKLFSTLSQEQVVTAMSLIGHSMEQMIQDPVFSVVQDSTISFPAVSGNSEKGASGRLSFSVISPKKSRATTQKSTGGPLFADALRQAQELLLEAHASALSSANSTMVHRISALLQSTVILLSATTTTKSKAIASSGFATFSVDLARNVTWKREQSILSMPGDSSKAESEAEVALSRRMSLGITTEMAKFQKNYVELVPKNWSVISVSLSDNRHDLCITKFQAGHSPFILRLPLERANSREPDSEVFNFEHGHEEMLDIIRLANETSNSGSRDFSVKGAKTAWWAEREALDERLRELLGAIETTWLGGFKGIFSQHERRPDLLARFQKNFTQILDGSLPSRNRMRGKKTPKTPKITLDPRILDLFIGLGDPTDSDADFDEALNDLLYFVVDILQFHGERNAYDEIDFDAMVVETYDALRGYYAAARGGGRADDAHTVLVLDKALHAFPWESMPCMEGLAVSRVPSLACLRQLILESRKPTADFEGDEDLPEGHYVSKARGTYILNPSTDLKNTQTTFQSTLKSLSNWTGIVNRAPKESEFEKALSTSEVLLYFGHGSGAQYVRSRIIRNLKKCTPATFLMGCSSASLISAGEFESYGPVWNYMMAGCPAVVGTLWDVTDRDIDRFAANTFEKWGLFPRGTFKEKSGKGKRRSEEDDDDEQDLHQHVSLAEAVAQSRDSCRFKYLNAAAVVLYGIPVYINQDE